VKTIQEVANLVGKEVALFEPTCIDELRIDELQISNLKINDLAEALLLPLTRRWPVGDMPRLGGVIESSGDEGGRVGIDPNLFQHCFQKDDEGQIQSQLSEAEETALFEITARTFANEVKRQITVRDYTLAEQADVIVVVRPYSNEDIAEVSGGVEHELESMTIRDKMESLSKPAIFVLHPALDEKTRRKNAFSSVSEQLWKHFGFGPFPDQFRQDLENLLVGHNLESGADLVSEIIQLSKNQKVKFSPHSKGSTMDGQSLHGVETSRGEFANKLVSSEILYPYLIVSSTKENAIVKIVVADNAGEEFIELLRRAEADVVSQ